MIPYDPHSCQKTQCSRYRLICQCIINISGRTGIDRKCIAAIQLQIIVKRGRIKRPRLCDQHIRHTKLVCQTTAFPSGIHHPHMGNKLALQIKARELDAIRIFAANHKHLSRDPAGCLSIRISRKLAINIRIILAPIFFSDIT